MSDDPAEGMPNHAALVDLAQRLSPLLRFGTSSWNYPGWRGLIYSRDYPGSGAGAAMLGEYAQWPLARTVGVDAFFYAPPQPKALDQYAAVLPADFRCVSKVWDRITTHTFVNPRDRARQGELNPDWLNAELFERDVLTPMREHFLPHTGPFVLEFTSVARQAMTSAAFAARLDAFFGALPMDMRYAVELRNAELLTPEYFAVLRNHGVAHVYNAWTRMPTIGEQMAMPDTITADFLVSRALLRQGRTFAEAVDAFAPYDRIRERNPRLRADLIALARLAIALRIPLYVLIGNRTEGCSPLTIAAIVEQLVIAGGS